VDGAAVAAKLDVPLGSNVFRLDTAPLEAALRTLGFEAADMRHTDDAEAAQAVIAEIEAERNDLDYDLDGRLDLLGANGHLEEAIDRTVAGLERKSRVMSEKDKERVAVHEMGHALVALSSPTADPVHRVSIIPRGAAALGMTMQRPLEDRYLLQVPELKDRLATAKSRLATLEAQLARARVALGSTALARSTSAAATRSSGGEHESEAEHGD